MQGSYWDLDDLLATNERVPCRAEVTGRGLGWLELGTRAKRSDLPLGTEMELPWWLATSLPGYVSLLLPATYRRTYRSHLIADPTTLALPSYYFHVGLALAALYALSRALVSAYRTTYLARGRHQDRELQELLRASFAQRYKLILDRSYNMRKEDLAATEKLTAVEQQRTLPRLIPD